MWARIEENRAQAGISLAFAVVSSYKIFLNAASNEFQILPCLQLPLKAGKKSRWKFSDHAISQENFKLRACHLRCVFFLLCTISTPFPFSKPSPSDTY